MGFWSSLGKTLLEAAPYIAAPFTGGVSLLAAPLTSKATDVWIQKNAASDAAQGIAPSSYDKYLGMAGDIGSIGAGVYGGVAGLSGLSSLGNAGKVLSMTAPIVGAAAGSALGGALGNKSGNPSSNSLPNTASSTRGLSPSTNALNSLATSARSPSMGTQVGQAVNIGPGTGGVNSMGIGPSSQMAGFGANQNNPNLANALSEGAAAGQQNLNRRGIYGNFSPYQASY